MIGHKGLLVGSASVTAILLAAAPAMAADAAATDASGSSTVSEVVVTGIRASLERAVAIKRNASDQVEAISSEDIGKLPDKNVADALTRIPGLNTESTASGEGGFDENDRVSIRGTSPSLTNVTIDGHDVATGDWFVLDQYQTVGRSVAFDLLPAEIVQNIEIYKTQDASILEGGVAGAIDIQTRSPLDLKKAITVEGSAQAAYNTNSSETKPQINGLFGWKNDNDTFGVIVQGFYEQRSVRRYGQETLGYEPITGCPPAPASCFDASGHPIGMPIGRANPSLIGVEAPLLIGSALFEQEKTREGVDGAVQWQPNSQWDFKLSGFYSHLNATNHNDNYLYWGARENSTNVPTSFTVTNNTLTSAVWPLNSPLILNQDGSTFQAAGPVDGLVVDNIIRPNATATSEFINLDATFHATDRLTFKGQVGYTEGHGDTPEQPLFEVDGFTGISIAQSGNGWTVTPANINPQSPAGLNNDWAGNLVLRSTDKEIYGKIDGDYEVNQGLLKNVEFGARIAQHTRQVDAWDRGCSLGADGQCFTAGLLPFSTVNPASYPSGFNAGALGVPGLLIPLAGDPNTILNLFNSITNPLRGPASHIGQANNYYFPYSFKVQETDYEGYLMAHVGGDNWNGNFGVRIADTQEHAFVNVPTCTASPTCTPPPGTITTSAFGNYYVDNVDHNYLDILPSANFTLDVTQKLLFRVSAAETMSRPDFSALGGAVSLVDTINTGNGGNPNLKPIRAAVIDGALEYYYGPSSVVAVSVFHDYLQSYVTFGNYTANYLNMFDGKVEPFTISAPSNIGGELSGVELQIQQPIAYGFGFQANGTYISGHDDNGAPLVGTSEWTGNIVGYYENKWVSARLAYTYRSHFFVGLDRSSAENQASNGTLDASVDFNVTPNVAITFDALNIANSLQKYYGANTTQVRAVYDNGTQLFVGVRARF